MVLTLVNFKRNIICSKLIDTRALASSFEARGEFFNDCKTLKAPYAAWGIWVAQIYVTNNSKQIFIVAQSLGDLLTMMVLLLHLETLLI